MAVLWKVCVFTSHWHVGTTTFPPTHQKQNSEGHRLPRGGHVTVSVTVATTPRNLRDLWLAYRLRNSSTPIFLSPRPGGGSQLRGKTQLENKASYSIQRPSKAHKSLITIVKTRTMPESVRVGRDRRHTGDSGKILVKFHTAYWFATFTLSLRVSDETLRERHMQYSECKEASERVFLTAEKKKSRYT